MPITKKLIEKMGGTITFESEEGVGTTFVIRVPFRIDTDRDRTLKQEIYQKNLSAGCTFFWRKTMNSIWKLQNLCFRRRRRCDQNLEWTGSC